MGSTASLLPGRNPAGTNLASDYSMLMPATGSSSGTNPIIATGSPGVSPSAPVSNNPYAPGAPTSPVPSFGANGSGATSLFGSGSSGSGSNPVSGTNTSRQDQRTLGELTSMYGEGLGGLLYNFMQSGAGFNQDAINNLFAALQPQVERGTENLMEQFSTSGNRFGSGAQIGLADYLSQVNLNEGQIESQMYEQSVNDYMNILMGTSSQSAQNKNNSPSIWDTIGNILNLGGSAAGAASAAGVGGTAGSILDTIGSLAGVI